MWEYFCPVFRENVTDVDCRGRITGICNPETKADVAYIVENAIGDAGSSPAISPFNSIVRDTV